MANVETKTALVAPAVFLLAADAAAANPGYITAAQARAMLANVDSINGHIETVAIKTYQLDKATRGYTINSFYQDVLTSGTCTLSVRINGTAVTGLSAVVTSTTESETNATALNVVAIGDIITMVVAANTACLDLFFRLKTTDT